MTFRKRRIVEILSGIAAHPKPFHDGSRTVVRRRREGYDVGERESPKGVTERQSGRLRCITVPPMREGQTPADFHAGREMGAESRDVQSGKPDKGGDTRDLDGPQAKAVLAEML